MRLNECDPLSSEEPLELLVRTIERGFEPMPDIDGPIAEWTDEKDPNVVHRAVVFMLRARSDPRRVAPPSKLELVMALSRLFGEIVMDAGAPPRKLFWRIRPSYEEWRNQETGALSNMVRLRVAIDSEDAPNAMNAPCGVEPSAEVLV